MFTKTWENPFEDSDIDLDNEEDELNIVDLPEKTIGSGIRIVLTKENKGRKICVEYNVMYTDK